ncbi:MAG: S8 family peptidase [Limnochordia bacterium]|jgi:subtilisin family serine protease
MKKLWLLFLGILVALVFTGCLLHPFGRGGSLGRPTSARDYFDYSAWDVKEGEVLVKANAVGSLEDVLVKEGSVISREWPEIGWVAATVPEGETVGSFMDTLKGYKEVLLVEPNLRYTLPVQRGVGELEILVEPEGDLYDRQWGFTNINAEAAWDLTVGAPDVIVAIIDTGVDVGHSEFLGKMFVDGYDATGEGMPDVDLNGHGTHVAGIAADDGRTGQVGGVAWDSPIMPVRVMNSAGEILTEYLIDALEYLALYAAVFEQRIVANMSLGGRGYSYALKDAIDLAISQGVVVIAAAGNEYNRSIAYPAAYNGVVSVAASTPRNERADFSSTGWWNSVAAPGERILSAYRDGYAYASGTSMAAPFVSGAAALLLAEYPELTPLEVKNQLEQTAQGVGFNERLGHGVIDMLAMLGPVEPMAYGTLVVETDLDPKADGYGVITLFASDGSLAGYGTIGGDGSHTFHGLAQGKYKVTLTYWDAPAEGWEIVFKEVHVNLGSVAEAKFRLDT